VLLSSIEGLRNCGEDGRRAARIPVDPGVVEDATDIILNLKQIRSNLRRRAKSYLFARRPAGCGYQRMIEPMRREFSTKTLHCDGQ